MKEEILRKYQTFFLMYNFHKMYTNYENWKLDPAMAATKYEKYEKVSYK